VTPEYRPVRPSNPPAFNIPGIVLATIALLAAIHFVRMNLLSEDSDFRVLLDFALIPACYSLPIQECLSRPSGAALWAPFTHAFLHGSWGHLGANTLWLVAFGTPVARRLGSGRFILFSLAGALGGAALFYIMNPDLLQPMIGASGVVSALMGGACRFALGAPGQLTSGAIALAPRMTVAQSLSNRTVLIFTLIFFATNIAIGSVGFGGDGASVAWEAHLGGFALGFLAFGFFDPVPWRNTHH